MAHIDLIEKLTAFRWINLFETHYRNKLGEAARWMHASRRASIAPGETPVRADAVVVVPIMIDQGQGEAGVSRKLVMIKEYRVPIQGYEFGFPAGLVEAGESYEETARRELKEETNLDLTKVVRTSPLLFSSPGMIDESAVMVFVECTGTPTSTHSEASEDILVLVLDHAGVVALASDHTRMVSAKAWPVLYLFEQLGRI